MHSLHNRCVYSFKTSYRVNYSLRFESGKILKWHIVIVDIDVVSGSNNKYYKNRFSFFIRSYILCIFVFWYVWQKITGYIRNTSNICEIVIDRYKIVQKSIFVYSLVASILYHLYTSGMYKIHASILLFERLLKSILINTCIIEIQTEDVLSLMYVRFAE